MTGPSTGPADAGTGAVTPGSLGAAPFALSATATSGLTVAFASNSTAVCTVSGVTVTLLTSAGSYDCRGQRSDHPERISEHALGRAVDITGFTLDDGSRITVQKNWWGKDEKAEFLHRVAAGAWKLFSVVLTPKSNKLHHDHLHLDNAPYKKCDA